MPNHELANKLGTLRVLVRGLFSPLAQGRLPDPSSAVRHPNGLVAVRGAVTPETVLEAYRKGLFTCTYRGPARWWSPDPRMVLFPDALKVQQGLRRVVRQKKFEVTFDASFREVIEACADRKKTWIREPLIAVFRALHERGHAHSVEVWDGEGQLVGGLFGTALGRVFFTESLFMRADNASKVAFMTLNCHLQHWGYAMNDLQFESDHWVRQGAVPLPRDVYLAELGPAVAAPSEPGAWSVDETLDVGAWEPSEPGSQSS